jgi:hypothetical protein
MDDNKNTKIVSRDFAAEYLGISKVYVSKLCKKIGLSKIGGSYIIKVSDLSMLDALRSNDGAIKNERKVKI